MMFRKLIALIIDYAVIIAFSFVVGIIIEIPVGFYIGYCQHYNYPYNEHLLNFGTDIVLYVITLIFCFLYYSHIFQEVGQTVGDRLMKIKIIPVRGEKISVMAGIIRTIFLAPFLAVIGFIPVSIKPYRPLLDFICWTNTVKAEQ